ncbi:hypothetical protein J6590_042053 [Homalodisca vitripennis]|nr:hypothetical protein J6590_042053 [Homalodisca vitripennis]
MSLYPPRLQHFLTSLSSFPRHHSQHCDSQPQHLGTQYLAVLSPHNYLCYDVTHPPRLQHFLTVFHRSLVITPSIVTASRSTWVHNIWLCSLRTITSPCIIDVTLPSPPPTLPHQSFIVPSSYQHCDSQQHLGTQYLAVLSPHNYLTLLIDVTLPSPPPTLPHQSSSFPRHHSQHCDSQPQHLGTQYLAVLSPHNYLTLHYRCHSTLPASNTSSPVFHRSLVITPSIVTASRSTWVHNIWLCSLRTITSPCIIDVTPPSPPPTLPHQSFIHCDSQPQHLGTQYLAVLSPHNYLTLHYRCHSTLPASNTSSPVFHRSLVITPSIVTASRSTWVHNIWLCSLRTITSPCIIDVTLPSPPPTLPHQSFIVPSQPQHLGTQYLAVLSPHNYLTLHYRCHSTLPASNTSSPVFHRSLVITPSIVTASRSTWVHNIWLCSLRTITSPCIIDVTPPSPPPTLPHQSFIVPSSSLLPTNVNITARIKGLTF